MPVYKFKLNLECFFDDHRRDAIIVVKKEHKKISDIKKHITNLFEISDYNLFLSNKYLLPDEESVHAISPDDSIWAKSSDEKCKKKRKRKKNHPEEKCEQVDLAKHCIDLKDKRKYMPENPVLTNNGLMECGNGTDKKSIKQLDQEGKTKVAKMVEQFDALLEKTRTDKLADTSIDAKINLNNLVKNSKHSKLILNVTPVRQILPMELTMRNNVVKNIVKNSVNSNKVKVISNEVVRNAVGDDNFFARPLQNDQMAKNDLLNITNEENCSNIFPEETFEQRITNEMEVCKDLPFVEEKINSSANEKPIDYSISEHFVNGKIENCSTVGSEKDSETEDFLASVADQSDISVNHLQKRKRVRRRKKKVHEEKHKIPVVLPSRVINLDARPKIHKKFDEEDNETIIINSDSFSDLTKEQTENRCHQLYEDNKIKENGHQVNTIDNEKNENTGTELTDDVVARIKSINEDNISKFPLATFKTIETKSLICFRILKLNEHFCPVPSNLLFGQVENCDSDSECIAVHIIVGIEEFQEVNGNLGGNCYEEDEEMCLPINRIQILKWHHLIEPRLLSN